MKIFTSFRSKMLTMTIIAVALPIFASGFVMIRIASDSIVAEKQQKLFGAAHILDLYLEGTYDDILLREGKLGAGRSEQIDVLNRALQEYTDTVASAYPGIGVGYYCKALDAIITYGPSSDYGDKVGLPISGTHQGRVVMETGKPRVQEGKLVRGWIMNAMHPIIRDGQIIGYIWANELMEDIWAQLRYMKTSMSAIIILAVIVGIIATGTVIDSLAANVQRIKRGVGKLKLDLSYKITVPKGEIGEIAVAINELARELESKRMLEEQIRRTERLELVGEVASGLAHEIRNPLMAIRGFAQLVQESVTSAESYEYLNVIMREANRMDRLIEELLCLGRPAPNSVPAPLDINPVVERAALLLDNQARQKRVSLRIGLASNLPKAMAEGEQLSQAVLNVLINALQATGSGGLVEVTTGFDAEQASVFIKVKDTGEGIAPQIKDRIFTPFFTTKEKGTGLGLSVVLRLVGNWGGKVLVDSTLGEGSTFTLLLPLEGGTDEQPYLNS